MKYIASGTGLTAAVLATKFNIQNAITDYSEILKDSDVDVVLITTRPNLHAQMVVEALLAGKHVFVEKPLALTRSELEGILEARRKSGKMLTVGFNRRFSPFAEKMKSLVGDAAMNIIVTVNAGFIPDSSWVHDPKIGGGRIMGEACHFIDLCSYLAQSTVARVCMNALGVNPQESTDNASIMLSYANGTNAVINYFSNGSKKYPKEKVEIFSQERVLVLDNWRSLRGYGFKGFSRMRSVMNKGHEDEFRLLLRTIKTGGKDVIPVNSLVNTTLATFGAIESLKTSGWVKVD